MLLMPGPCGGNRIRTKHPSGIAVDAYLVPVFPISVEALLPLTLGPILQYVSLLVEIEQWDGISARVLNQIDLHIDNLPGSGNGTEHGE